MIEQAIYSKLTGDAAVSALVSSRVYPIVAPQKAAKPFIVYRRLDTEHPNCKSRGRTTDAARALIEVQAVASSYSGARTLADKVRLCLSNFAGVVSVTGGGSITIGGILSEGEVDDSEMPPDATDQPRHRVTQDFGVWFNETAPT